MRAPSHITFTGVDQWTSVPRMIELSRQYPIEWAVLCSYDKAGQHPRYPAPADVAEFVNTTTIRKAAHLCDELGRQAAIRMEPHPHYVQAFERMQINHRNPSPLETAIAAEGSTPYIPTIMQWRGPFPETRPRYIQLLFDQSGGRGQLPSEWPKYPGYWVGYAGGISAANVIHVIDAIDADGPYWLDMESSVRDEDDHFDLDRVQVVCEAVFGGR